MQLSNWAAGYFTVTIAVHTFNSLVLRVRQSVLVCSVTITIGWSLALLMGSSYASAYHATLSDIGQQHLYRSFSPGKVGRCMVLMGFLVVFSMSFHKTSSSSTFFRFVTFCPTRSLSHCLQIFIASILSAILYSIVFLVLRGTLVIKGGLKLTLDPHERWSAGGVSANYHRFIARIARSMLW